MATRAPAKFRIDEDVHNRLSNSREPVPAGKRGAQVPEPVFSQYPRDVVGNPAVRRVELSRRTEQRDRTGGTVAPASPCRLRTLTGETSITRNSGAIARQEEQLPAPPLLDAQSQTRLPLERCPETSAVRLAFREAPGLYSESCRVGDCRSRLAHPV